MLSIFIYFGALISLENEYPIEMNSKNIKHPVIDESVLKYRTINWEYIGGILSLAFLYVISKQQTELKKEDEQERKELAPIIALRSLEAINTSDKQLLYSNLTVIVRNYLEDYYSLRATKETTEEFLHHIAKSPYFDPKTQEALAQFLSKADIVKFAEYTPTEEECRKAIITAENLIKSSEVFNVSNVFPNTKH